MNLVVLGEHLCVYGDIGIKQIEVYAMKEYGKKESWTRLFVIPCGILKSIHSSTDVKPLCLTKNGQVLMSVGKRGVGIYDPKDCTFLVYDCDRGWMPMPYVETLVSLPSKTNGITLTSTLPPPSNSTPPPPSNSAPPPPPLPPPPQTQPSTRQKTLAHHWQPKPHQ
ncbi:hypothetical protein Vadar_002501 [Vaccinium darrowii]|uniref:Uncharacterized protein n=1 Tax=Vaccinium darrowii TaxID=229202 RepID=A0ACB7WXC0_9ERIC|nr:hypothetical protein Vadar_002501 [Vaccinium darrowii]